MQDQIWPCPWSHKSHSEAFSYSCFESEGILLSPDQQPVTRCECGSRRPPPVGTSPLPSPLQTATIEGPASHVPDIFSETPCWPAKPYGSILPLRIPSVRSLFLKDGRGEQEQSRERREGSPVPQSPWPWLDCLLWGMLVRPRGCQEGLLLGGSATWALALPTTAARRCL